MPHAYHPHLNGYVEDAIFHSGCPECESRARMGLRALKFMDEDTTRRAFDRALKLELDGLSDADEIELPFLRDAAYVLLAVRATGYSVSS